MATSVTNPDYFRIAIDSNVNLSYQKNGSMKLGGYSSRSQYAWEVLFRPDISGIPAGSTVDSVTMDVNYIDNNTQSTVSLTVWEQDKGSWTDNGSTEPRRGIAPFNDYTEWTTSLSSVNVGGFQTGIFTIPTSSSLVNWFQGIVNGNTNDGLILTGYSDYFSWYGTIDAVEVTVNYTAGSTRRRIMIIS